MAKIVLLGYGSIGQRHARSMASLGIRPRDVVAADPLLKEGRTEDGLLCYKDSVEAISKHARDAVVIIASPTRFHVEHTMAAVQHGARAIYLEKPPAETLAAWLPAAEAVSRAGVRLAVGFNWRYHPLTDFWRRVISLVHRVIFLSVDDIIDWPSAHTKNSYIFRPGEGGVLLTSTVHTLDLAMHLMGPIMRLRSMQPLGTGEFHDVDMDILVEAEHASGQISIIGNHWSVGAPSVSCIKADDTGHIFITDVYSRDCAEDNENMHLQTMQAFLHYAKTGESGQLCLLDGATAVMETLDACQRSNIAWAMTEVGA